MCCFISIGYEMVDSTRDELIKHYFNIGFSYKEIFSFSFNSSQYKFIFASVEKSSEKHKFIKKEIKKYYQQYYVIYFELITSTRCFGYGAMHQKLLMNGYLKVI